MGAGGPWSAVFGAALWIAYKFVKGVIIGLGLGGTGLPTTIGALATLALYTASVRLIERRSPDELGLAQLAPELALGVTFGAVLFSVVMAVVLAIGAYAMTGPTACLYRKLDSAIMMMKSAEHRPRGDAAYVLDGAMDRSVFAKRPMSPQLVIISGIFRQDPA